MTDGVRFIDEHLEPDVDSDDKCMTYYIVNLKWIARSMTDHKDRYSWGSRSTVPPATEMVGKVL